MVASVVVIKRDGADGERYVLDDRQWCTIGSHPECDIIVHSDGVAKLQTLVRVHPSGVASVFGLDTELPTTVPSMKASLYRDEGVEISHGNVIIVGERGFRFETFDTNLPTALQFSPSRPANSVLRDATNTAGADSSSNSGGVCSPSPAPDHLPAQRRRSSLVVHDHAEIFVHAPQSTDVLTVHRKSLPATTVVEEFFSVPAKSTGVTTTAACAPVVIASDNPSPRRASFSVFNSTLNLSYEDVPAPASSDALPTLVARTPERATPARAPRASGIKPVKLRNKTPVPSCGPAPVSIVVRTPRRLVQPPPSRRASSPRPAKRIRVEPASLTAPRNRHARMLPGEPDELPSALLTPRRNPHYIASLAAGDSYADSTRAVPAARRNPSFVATIASGFVVAEEQQSPQTPHRKPRRRPSFLAANNAIVEEREACTPSIEARAEVDVKGTPEGPPFSPRLEGHSPTEAAEEKVQVEDMIDDSVSRPRRAACGALPDVPEVTPGRLVFTNAAEPGSCDALAAPTSEALQTLTANALPLATAALNDACSPMHRASTPTKAELLFEGLITGSSAGASKMRRRAHVSATEKANTATARHRPLTPPPGLHAKPPYKSTTAAPLGLRSAISKRVRKQSGCAHPSALDKRRVLFADAIGDTIELGLGAHYSPVPKRRLLTPRRPLAKDQSLGSSYFSDEGDTGTENDLISDGVEGGSTGDAISRRNTSHGKQLSASAPLLPKPSPRNPIMVDSDDVFIADTTNRVLLPPPTPLRHLGKFFYSTAPIVPLLMPAPSIYPPSPEASDPPFVLPSSVSAKQDCHESLDIIPVAESASSNESDGSTSRRISIVGLASKAGSAATSLIRRMSAGRSAEAEHRAEGLSSNLKVSEEADVDDAITAGKEDSRTADDNVLTFKQDANPATRGDADEGDEHLFIAGNATCPQTSFSDVAVDEAGHDHGSRCANALVDLEEHLPTRVGQTPRRQSLIGRAFSVAVAAAASPIASVFGSRQAEIYHSPAPPTKAGPIVRAADTNSVGEVANVVDSSSGKKTDADTGAGQVPVALVTISDVDDIERDAHLSKLEEFRRDDGPAFESWTVKELREYIAGFGIAWSGMRKADLVKRAINVSVQNNEPDAALTEATSVLPTEPALDLTTCTVVELRRMLSRYGLDSTGRKRDLILRLEEAEMAVRDLRQKGRVIDIALAESCATELEPTTSSALVIGTTRMATEKPECDVSPRYLQLTVKELRRILQNRDLDVSGRKTDLVNRLVTADVSSTTAIDDQPCSLARNEQISAVDESARDDVSSWTVACLRNELKSQGLSVVGKKADLIERLTNVSGDTRSKIDTKVETPMRRSRRSRRVN
jgi:SAP domain